MMKSRTIVVFTLLIGVLLVSPSSAAPGDNAGDPIYATVGQYSNSLDGPTDETYYFFNRTGDYTLSLNAASDTDYDIQVFDENFNTIGFAEGTTYPELFYLSNLQIGVYIRIYSIAGSGPFTLDISEGIAQTTTSDVTYPDTTVGTTIEPTTSTIHVSSDYESVTYSSELAKDQVFTWDYNLDIGNGTIEVEVLSDVLTRDTNKQNEYMFKITDIEGNNKDISRSTDGDIFIFPINGVDTQGNKVDLNKFIENILPVTYIWEVTINDQSVQYTGVDGDEKLTISVDRSSGVLTDFSLTNSGVVDYYIRLKNAPFEMETTEDGTGFNLPLPFWTSIAGISLIVIGKRRFWQ